MGYKSVYRLQQYLKYVLWAAMANTMYMHIDTSQDSMFDLRTNSYFPKTVHDRNSLSLYSC